VRAVLSIYLSLTLLAGPALCCCTSRLLRATSDPAPATVRTATPADGEESPRGCCHCRHGQATQPHTQDSPRKPRPSSPTAPCPCKEHAAKAALLAAGPDAPRLAAGSPWLLGLALDVSACGLHDGAISSVTSPAGIYTAFWDAQAALRAHHILRC
jgi:hypothetical protein